MCENQGSLLLLQPRKQHLCFPSIISVQFYYIIVSRLAQYGTLQYLLFTVHKVVNLYICENDEPMRKNNLTWIILFRSFRTTNAACASDQLNYVSYKKNINLKISLFFLRRLWQRKKNICTNFNSVYLIFIYRLCQAQFKLLFL